LFALTLLVAGLGYWGATARISGAVVVTGAITVQNQRQVVQHLDGGIVGEILSRDGDVVAAGQVLIRLENIRQKSELAIVENQLQDLAIRTARLVAERNRAASIEYSSEQIERATTDSALATQIQSENSLFQARLVAARQETEQLNEQIAQVRYRADGYSAQRDALALQTKLLETELGNQKELQRRGLTQAARVSALQREQASLSGQIGMLTSDIAEMRARRAVLVLERLRLQTKRQKNAIEEIREIQFKEVELKERRITLLDVLSRVDIRAPEAGIVHNSRVFALRSVIRPGDPVMYIIPQDKPLIISARVNAKSIEQVHIGQSAWLRFSAFDQRTGFDIDAAVSKISADALKDDGTSEVFYSVELAPMEHEVGRLSKAVVLPGMPVEVFIKTGDRSPMAYLTEPFLGFFARAFRE
jgi:HlyD family secretion protein